MKIINVMNFIRSIEPRPYDSNLIINFHSKTGLCDPNAGAGLTGDEYQKARVKEGEKGLYETARLQLELAKEMGVPTTFLLQYDVISNGKYVEMFKDVPDFIELGVWYEVVRPMADDAGVEYNSQFGWDWDWHIDPGFSMSYTQSDREKLITTTMEKFKSTFGKYPKTVGSWLIDTYTVNYLTDNYDLDALCICRDQVNTDAYTLIGGYFNQGYYPSRNNMFTPARTPELRVNTPILRLLGPDPIHNYDGNRYVSEGFKGRTVYTMECASDYEPDYDFVDWYYKNTFTTEDMGFSYTQIGQENSFGMYDLPAFTRMRIERAKDIPGVEFKTMGDTGRAIKEKYGYSTPVSANVALDNWDSKDLQTAYYNCENYVANLFRNENKTFIRALYLFDERVPDHYYSATCKTFDAVYENQPVIDTIRCEEGVDNAWYIDAEATAFTAERTGDEELCVNWGDKRVIFSPDCIEIVGATLTFSIEGHKAGAKLCGSSISYFYNGRGYTVTFEGGNITCEKGKVTVTPVQGRIRISFSLDA